jgi:hypothetical protein
MNQLVPDLRSVVVRLLETARALGVPVVIYPFGPKLMVFSALYIARRQYPEASWMVYPVARTHSINYSEGILRTVWVNGTEFAVTD